MARWGVGDVAHLRLGDIQQLGQLHPVLDHFHRDGEGGGLELFAHFVEVKGHNAVFHVHVGFMGKHIQAALNEQLGGQGQLLRLPLRLGLDFPPPVGQKGLGCLAAALDEVVVDGGGTAVNDGFLVGPKLSRSHLLLTDGHKQLGLHRHRVFPGPVALGDLQRIDMVGTVGGRFR